MQQNRQTNVSIFFCLTKIFTILALITLKNSFLLIEKGCFGIIFVILTSLVRYKVGTIVA